MIHDLVVLGYTVLCGIVAPGADEGLLWRGLDGLNTNSNRDFCYRNDADSGLTWFHLTK